MRHARNGALGMAALLALAGSASCGESSKDGLDFPRPADPDTAPEAEVDRFSEAAGTILVRAQNNALPAPGAPIDFDQAPFITLGLGPAGEPVRYYHFDVRDQRPAAMYVPRREDSGQTVAGQLPIIDVLPGTEGYNDFFRVYRVKVPESYKANALTSRQQIDDLGLEIVETDRVINQPIVPKGSTAVRRVPGQDSEIRRLWYRGSVAHALTFEDPVRTTMARDGSLIVALSYIFVTFNIDADEPGGGPCSGFMTEAGTEQTHNVVETMPPDAEYSPLWNVIIYDNTDFGTVSDIASARAATVVPGVESPIVNCPIVEIGP